MAAFMGVFTVSDEDAHRSMGRQAHELKGARRGSLAAVSRGLKHLEGARRFAGFPYPQKLWTTLWTESSPGLRYPGPIAFFLPWSKNQHAFFDLFLNGF